MDSIKERGKLFPFLTALGIAALGFGLVSHGAAVAEGVSRGLSVSGNVLIPSLFPFMALASFLAGTKYGAILSRPLWLVTTRLFRLPGELGFVVLLSLIGGYPVGARLLAELLREGRIDKATAERMLCFSVNAGPSFVITAVGAGMLASREAGVILFATQAAAAVLIGVLVSLRAKPRESKARPLPPSGNAAALVAAVNSAAAGMLTMCAFAILFSGFLSLLNALGTADALAALIPLSPDMIHVVMAAFLEVSAGVAETSRVAGLAGFLMTGAAISFGGCSVLFQILSCFRGLPVRFRPFLLSRLAHMALSAAMAAPLYTTLGKTVPVSLVNAPPHFYATSRTALLSVCVLAMCAMLTLRRAVDN